MFFIYIFSVFFLYPPKALANSDLDHSASYAYFMKGLIEKANGKFDEAERSFKTALKKDPNEVNILKELAEIAIHKKNFNEARYWAEAVLKQSPNDVDTMILLARIYVHSNRIKDAIEVLEKALDKAPGNTQALFFLGNIYMEIKQYDKAIDVLERSLKEETQNSFMIHYYLGRLYFDSNKLVDAERHFKKAVQLNPNMVDAYYGLALIYKKRGDVEDAIGAFDTYLHRRPQDLKARDDYIRFLIDAGRNEKALKEIDEFYNQDSSDPRVGFRTIGYYLDLGQYQKALEVLDRLQILFPDSPQLHFYRGLALEGLGQKDKAKHSYEKIREEEPIYILARIRIAKILKEEGDYKGALHVLEEVESNKNIAHRSQINEVLLEMALLLDEIGRRDQAIETAKKILETDPENPSALNFIGYTYAEMGIKLGEAEDLIKKALKKRPDDGYILDSLGWVYYKKGRIGQAIEVLKKAVSRVPDDPIINEHLGDAYYKNGDYDEAWYQYEKSLRLFKQKKDKKRIKEKMEKAQEGQEDFMLF
ncbi:tetratricopeptide repeat protein [Dissulfuribacter thermophilus]|uniref:tetratricopeptide repeat protein n=1 Tax=Dissulfuribacter thermophilus TaxID=1156395 RepID=UPI0013793F88|nr:tetratricopeptide repeat protein [Dissulfuribacter thermophilus]